MGRFCRAALSLLRIIVSSYAEAPEGRMNFFIVTLKHMNRLTTIKPRKRIWEGDYLQVRVFFYSFFIYKCGSVCVCVCFHYGDCVYSYYYIFFLTAVVLVAEKQDQFLTVLSRDQPLKVWSQ